MPSTLSCPAPSRQLDFPPSMNCHACGAALAPTAKYCHKCGAQVGDVAAAGWRAGLPWSVAGAALGALLTVLALRIGASSGGGVGGAGGGGGGPPPASRISPPDIFPMFPEKRATPLYHPGMLLHTPGKTGSAEVFL